MLEVALKCLEAGHALQLLLHTRALSIRERLLAEQDLSSPLELAVVLLGEVVVEGCLEDPNEDLELDAHRLPISSFSPSLVGPSNTIVDLSSRTKKRWMFAYAPCA